MTDQATVPHAPGGLPLLGHALSLVRDPLAFLKSLPRHGDLVRIRIGPAAAIVICDPELTRDVLRDDRTFDKGGVVIDAVREAVGDGITTSPRSIHRRLRRLAQPAFHHARLTGYAHAMTAQIDATTAGWRRGQVLNVPAEMLSLTMKVAAETMLSGTLSPVALSQAIADLNVLLAGMYRRTITPPRLKRLSTPANRRHFQARSRLQQTIEAIVVERRTSATGRDDLLESVLNARDLAAEGNGQLPTVTEVRDQILTYFNAGSETLSNLLSWTLHLLAHHPDVEERLHSEVDAVLAGSPATLEHLPELELTSRILTETLRLYPPSWIITRSTTAKTILGHHLIPAGTTLVYSPYVIHHRSDLYQDPEKFDPDRWTTSPPPPHAFIPFGGGARKCIGDQFALTEASLALATIANRWTLRPAGNHSVRPTPAITLRPRGLRMLLIRRGTVMDQEETSHK
ncbi:cytochrome P450 [Streptomyces alanosinicus]|uniref:Cytochrome P450 n=1 Tax=Streptomyces alanosinicus TaxID=68171 RepID=A0A919D4H5_9ACTN|nr:cytochrome P450 [Streptomyces alanosinicus]GHE09726.1 cytochrome P450 [Streptomyces alanosinicus]